MPFHLPTTPNNVYSSREKAINAATHPFELAHEANYDYCFNRLFSEIEYSSAEYQNSQDVSPRFRDHILSMVRNIELQLPKSSRILEIGCGKGFFLEQLVHNGFENIFGYDATYQGSSPRVQGRYFDQRDIGFGADAIILRHTLEHIPKPLDFLRNILQINANPQAKIFIEVPCFDWIRRSQSYWDLTIEHCNYFSRSSFEMMLPGAAISSVFDDQYLWVSARASQLSLSVNDEQNQVSSIDLHTIFPSIGSVTDSGLENKLSGRYWVWGSGTKGIMFLWHLSKLFNDFKPPLGLIDINPAKQGKFISCLGYKIEPPEALGQYLEDGDTVLVVNPAYSEEIMSLIKGMSSTAIYLASL